MRNVLLVLTMCLTALVIYGCKETVTEPVANRDTIDEATKAWYGVIDAEIVSHDRDQHKGNDDDHDGEDHDGKCDPRKPHTHRNFIAILSGNEEVPARQTHGRGVAKFKLSKDKNSIHYKLIVANISNVVGAHVHKAVKGENGPVVFELYSAAPGGGRTQGPLSEGDFTAADLVGPFGGSGSLELFLENLHSDSLYVNVHTNDGVDPPNTGKGDFPGGEIRGQLK